MKNAATEDRRFAEELHARLQIFVDQWRVYEGTEQAGAQQFLQSLVEIYEVEYTPGTIFEQHPVRSVARTKSQGSLFPGTEAVPRFTTERMDMYLPKICVWEMKAPSERDLERHHEQLLGYWARMRTRYMVLCNFRELWIYDTNDEGGQLTPKLRIPINELPARGDALLFLRGEVPDLGMRAERITAEVARMLGHLVREVVENSKEPALDRDRITKLLLQCVFAMFAEDTDLIPAGLFTTVMQRADRDGQLDALWALFEAFARNEGSRNFPSAPYVNGPLFDRSQPRIALSADQVHALHCAARDFDWRDVRPEIFGSIFEQALDPVERHELGAHFTREADIARVVWPTVVVPWQQRIAALRHPKEAEECVAAMRAYHVLDPACGCGNFLYVVYREMKRLESALAVKWVELQRKVAKRRADIRPPPERPYFSLHQLHGIEINPFAAFLARVVLWIGEHLANSELGLDEPTLPLKNLDSTIRHSDALLMDAWPRPDGELAIVSNPPYLGVRKLRRELGDELVEQIFQRYPRNRAADYVTYWFTRALQTLRPGERAGYVCTNSVAQNESREASIDLVLEAGGTITDAYKSYPWPGDAAVHIAIVNWIMAPYDGVRTLEGVEVASISPGLTTSTNVTEARTIAANEKLCFMGVTPGNTEFVVTDEQREEILANDPSSARVVRPFLVGRDVNREVDSRPTRWIIDFGTLSKEDAEKFTGAMHHVRKYVYPIRKNNRRESRALNWWKFAEPAPKLREAIRVLNHVLVIPCVSPRLIVSRQTSGTCFDHQLMVVALSSHFHFGLMQSRVHSAWAWGRGSTLKGDLRYTNTTIFETFPFPLLPNGKYDPRVVPESKQAKRVAKAAEIFDRLRSEACKERKLGLTKIHNILDAGAQHAAPLPELAAAYDEMNNAVCACYGFAEATWRDEAEVLRLLLEMNGRVAGA